MFPSGGEAVQALPFLLALTGPFQLRLIASPEVECPQPDRVREALVNLGVDRGARSGTAAWALFAGHLRLRVIRTSSKSSGAALEREIPLAPCDELTQIVALSIERATAPLGELAKIDPGTEPSGGRGPEDPSDLAAPAAWSYAVHGGFRVLRSDRTAYGGEVEAEVWPSWSQPVGATLALGGSLPIRLESAGLGLNVVRVDLALGVAYRLALAEVLSIGLSGALLVDFVHGDTTSALLEQSLAREVRAGVRGAGWIEVRSGRFDLRVEPTIRSLPNLTYHARPGALFQLRGVEGGVVLGIGIRFAP